MKQKEIEALALLRYRLILPVLHDEFEEPSANQYFEKVALEPMVFPDGTKRTIRPATLRMWLNKYRKDGFEGLKDKQRTDKGKPRSLTDEQKEVILSLKTERPRRTATSIYKQCIEDGVIKKSDASLSTVQRYMRKIQPHIGSLITEDRRAFEMAHANDLWQIDTSYGPYLTIDGKKTQVYMIMIIDDASRLIVGHGIFDADNAVNVQIVIKEALQKYGTPKRIYSDNGKPYRNEQLEIICATLGIGLKRAQVYRPQHSGKIERNFRSVKETWMYNLNYHDFETCEALNTSLGTYVIEKNNTLHASLKMTPWDRYNKDASLIHYHTKEKLDEAFLHTVKRRVNNDATIKFDTRLYEAPQRYIGQSIILRYQPDLSKVYLYDEIKDTYHEVKEVDKVANSQIKRKQPILSTMKEKIS
jgi:putative transposase